MARSKSNIYGGSHGHESNPFGADWNDRAEKIADASLRNEFVNPADSHGIVPGTLRTIAPDVEVKHLQRSRTGRGDSSKGHDNEPVDSAVRSVTNPRQSHEKNPVDFEPHGVHADDYKNQDE